MRWIVVGEEKGKIKLVSKKEVPGLIPKGSYLTIEEGDSKFILRVEDSLQNEPYSPSPMLADMDLSSLDQDRKCQNIIHAYRVKDIIERPDGYIDYIRPQSIARRSNQEEIDIAIGGVDKGPKVFVGTIHSSQNQLLTDDNGKLITAKLPVDMFFHQMLICGRTGSGKTVAMKYLAQWFAEELEGAVLAINVKDVDFLKMDKPSVTGDKKTLKEWKHLGQTAHGMANFIVYYPANTEISPSKGVNPSVCEKITLNVEEIEPEALTGLLHGISDIGAQNLPNIFRYWQESQRRIKNNKEFTFSNFVKYFANGINDGYMYRTLSFRGDDSDITLHRGTYDNILRNLDPARDFFDNEDAKPLDWQDILVPGAMSVIDVTGKNGTTFGSVLLRNLLHRIVTAKSNQQSDVPVLVIIDEVHMFYDTEASKEALGDLDLICRTGRSQKIGVIFSSQNPADIPRGLSTVINTKIFFKSDATQAKPHGIVISSAEMESLKKGYAVATIQELSQLKVLKFPLAYAGVFPED